MDKEKFLFVDEIKQIQSSFIKDGWVTIYECSNTKDDQYLVYCCLVDSKTIKKYKQDREWMIYPTMEGKPSIISTYPNGKEQIKYYTYDEKGVEPFIFVRDFSFADVKDKYVDISEEFVFYFKLYEKPDNKQNRKYYFIDDAGDFDEVIKIESNKVKIKLKYLMEYISIRKIYFSICFDFVRFGSISSDAFDILTLDKDYQSGKYFYNHFIRPIPFVDVDKLQSWIHGKAFIDFDKKKTTIFYFDGKNQKYEDFITGYDNQGNEVYESCKKTNEKYFTLTYFKKEVLNKYYNQPTKYKVGEGSVQSSFFTLKIDNNVEDYVPVFLVELSFLPHKEQLHWKQYNIPPQKGISNTYYKRMIEGSWEEYPETPDLYFKYKYESFNGKWKDKFGWQFYKNLAKQDEHYFTSLHIPTTNNVKAFCEQVLSIVKITIDRLNEAEFAKDIILKENEKGISKLEKYLKSKDVEIPDMILFLRNLQDLRSGLIAHSFSSSNKNCKRAMEYFGIKENNYIEVAKDIFIKSIWTINALEKEFQLYDSDTRSGS